MKDIESTLPCSDTCDDISYLFISVNTLKHGRIAVSLVEFPESVLLHNIKYSDRTVYQTEQQQESGCRKNELEQILLPDEFIRALPVSSQNIKSG